MAVEYWRICCGVTKQNKIRNEEMRMRMEVTYYIINHIEKERLMWYDHVRNARRLIGFVTDWSPMDGKRRGRPKRITDFILLISFHYKSSKSLVNLL